MVDVSIIIVNWNTKVLISQCIESIEKYTAGVEYEIIVIDNNSSDGSVEYIEERFPFVRVFRQKENLGFAKANNVGIHLSKGKNVFLINSDVKLIDNIIYDFSKKLDDNPAIGLLGPLVLNDDLSIQKSQQEFPSIRSSILLLLGMKRYLTHQSGKSINDILSAEMDSTYEVDVLYGCFWAVRKIDVNKIGGLDEKFFFYGEDIDWCKRFSNGGYRIILDTANSIVHYKGASTIIKPLKYYLQMNRANLQYWSKHSSFWEYRCYIVIQILYHISRSISSFWGRGRTVDDKARIFKRHFLACGFMFLKLFDKRIRISY